MFGPSVKVSKNLMEKLKLASEFQGCTCVDEFALSVLEKEADRVIREHAKHDPKALKEDITNKLKGLGYID